MSPKTMKLKPASPASWALVKLAGARDGPAPAIASRNIAEYFSVWRIAPRISFRGPDNSRSTGPLQRQEKKERANTGFRMARPVKDRPGAESAVQFPNSRPMLLRSGHSSVCGLVEPCPLHPRSRLSIRPAFPPATSGSTRRASVRREF